MNNTGRKVLHKVLGGLERLRDPIMDRETALDILKDAQDKVEKSMDEEEFSIDCIPENLQFSSRADAMRGNLSDLTDASSDLECVVVDCENMEAYSYQLIKSDILKIIRSIELAINRR